MTGASFRLGPDNKTALLFHENNKFDNVKEKKKRIKQRSFWESTEHNFF